MPNPQGLPSPVAFRLDNLLLAALVAVALAWLVDFLGCRLGYSLGILSWLYGTLDPLAVGLASFCALVGVIMLVFRRAGAAMWLITAVGLVTLPRLFEVYAPTSCVVS